MPIRKHLWTDIKYLLSHIPAIQISTSYFEAMPTTTTLWSTIDNLLLDGDSLGFVDLLSDTGLDLPAHIPIDSITRESVSKEDHFPTYGCNEVRPIEETSKAINKISSMNSLNDFISILENNNSVLPSMKTIKIERPDKCTSETKSIINSNMKRNIEGIASSKPHAGLSSSNKKLKKANPMDQGLQDITLHGSDQSLTKKDTEKYKDHQSTSENDISTKSPELVPKSSNSNDGRQSDSQSVGNEILSNLNITADKGDLKTQDTFKGIAKAAIANLITNANPKSNQEESNACSKPINTSTVHINALTSDNWVAACAAGIGRTVVEGPAALTANSAAYKATRAKKTELTAEDRAKQARDRNREHARNTRLRKKAYVEELKRTLVELVVQRDSAESEKNNELQRIMETREVRFKVMNEFLKLRAQGSDKSLVARWCAILDDNFILKLPQISPDTSSPQQLHGAKECYENASQFASFINLLFKDNNEVTMMHECDVSHFMMDGVRAMLDWKLTASPFEGYNGPRFIIKGYLKAEFSPSTNKLSVAELIYNSEDIQNQIKNVKSFSKKYSINNHTRFVTEHTPSNTNDGMNFVKQIEQPDVVLTSMGHG